MSSSCAATLNEGRGANPGDTRGARATIPYWPVALNEGRGANPGDTRPDTGPFTRYRPLNEGRGANPGDTSGEAARQ